MMLTCTLGQYGLSIGSR